MKYLIKENKILKNQLNSLNNFNLTTKNDMNFSLGNKDFDLNNNEYFKKQIELFKKKISSIENKLLEQKNINKQLLNENLLLKKQMANPSESKRNNDISQLLIEFDNLKKENINKDREIEKLNFKINTINNNINEI